MKKLFLLMIAGLMIFASCKKDKNPQYPFDHLQWITEEMDGCDLSNYGIDDCARLPEGRLLMDVGATKEDKGYLAWVVTSSDEHYSSGDIVLIDEDSYSYNPETGSFSFPGFDDAMVSFISETKVKVDYDGTATVFELATKNYKVKNAIDPLPAGPTAFTLTPEKTSEWAGGSVQINANREVVTWSVEVKGHPVDGAPMPVGSQSSISQDGVLTLAMYKQAVTNPTPVSPVVVVTAETSDGQTATCEVASMAWSASFYECADGVSSCWYQFNVFNHASWGSYFYHRELMCVQIVDPTDENSAVTDEDFLSKVNIESVEMNNAGISPRGRDGNEFQFLVDASSTAGGNFKVKVTYGEFTYTVGPIDVRVP